MPVEDVERLKFDKRVADRLAAQTMPRPSKVHCWGCGKNAPWFSCDCERARAWQEARDRGNHAGHPRFNVKTNCIEGLDEETILLNVALGYKRAVFGTAKEVVTPIRVRGTKAPPAPNNVTPSANNVTAGQPRRYDNPADKQKAYRARLAQRKG